MQNLTKHLATIILSLSSVFPQHTNAETLGLGFGYDTNQAKELIYSVNLTSGSVTAVGEISGLQYLSLGSYDFSNETRVAVVLGVQSQEATGSVFAIDAVNAVALEFVLPVLDGVTFQDTVINPKDGYVYAVAYDRTSKQNQIYKITLTPGSAAGAAAQAQAALVTSFTVEGYVAGATAIGKDGIMRLLITQDSTSSILEIDLTTAQQSTLALAEIHQSLFVCSQPGKTVPALYSINYNKDSGNNFYSVASDGTLTLLGSSSNVATWSSGSQICDSEKLSILGMNASGSNNIIFSIPRAGGDVTEMTLTSSNLKLVYSYATGGSLANQVSFAVKKPKTILSITPQVLGKCARKIKSLQSRRSLKQVIAATRTLKFSKNACKRR